MGKTYKSNDKPLKLAPFRTERRELVRKYAKETVVQLHSLRDVNSSDGRKALKKERSILRKRQIKILWFDQKRYTTFLTSYIIFIKTTLNIDISKELDHIISVYELRALTRSPEEALIFFKKIYSTSCRIAASSKFEKLEFTRVNSRGEPKILGPLLPLLHGNLDERRAALSVIKVLELITAEGKYSSESLTKIWLTPNLPIGEPVRVGNYFERALDRVEGVKHGFNRKRLIRCYKKAISFSFPRKERNIRLSDVSRLSEKHFSGRNGPNGPCLSTIVLDYSALVENSEGREILKAIIEFATLTNNQELLDVIQSFQDDDCLVISRGDGSNTRPIHSKISLKKEPWGRQRLFAITDWFSHSCLRGYRNTLKKWLVEQPQDGTVNQDAIVEQIRLWTVSPGPKQEPESTDLTTATDSIPVEVQQEIASEIMSTELASFWRIICTARTFKSPDGVDLRYAMGQPMGLSSSWESMAVWNHIMCRTAFLYTHGIDYDLHSAKYGVVGDDVTIQGADVNKVYTFIVSTLQGVGISPLKGFHMENQQQSNILPHLKDGVPMVAAEFCKRIICSGYEITPVPPKEVYTSFRQSNQFPELLFSIKRRGYPDLSVTEVPILTNLSNDRKLALLLSTNPLRIAPPFTAGSYNLLRDVEPFDKLIWFIPEYDSEDLQRSLLRIVEESMQDALVASVWGIFQWICSAGEPGEKTVKNWYYTCIAQDDELVRVAWDSRSKMERISKSFERKIDEGLPYIWSNLRQVLKKIKVLFDVSSLYTEGKYTEKDNNSYQNNFLAKATKKFVTEYTLKNVIP
jgi:hypothetical protein